VDTEVPEKGDVLLVAGADGDIVKGPPWALGFFVSTVGKDEAVIREYIKTQEKEDHRVDQLNLIE
jgi:hypothetical protein